MPELCRFDGIVFIMYYADHLPPHFHVRDADFRAKFDIATLEILNGKVKRKFLKKNQKMGDTE